MCRKYTNFAELNSYLTKIRQVPCFTDMVNTGLV